MNIAEAVKKSRTLAGMTQEELARFLDVSVFTISGWERGKTIPNAEVFQRIQALAAKEKKGA